MTIDVVDLTPDLEVEYFAELRKRKVLNHPLVDLLTGVATRQYVMGGYRTLAPAGWVTWVVTGTPDVLGVYYPGGAVALNTASIRVSGELPPLP